MNRKPKTAVLRCMFRKEVERRLVLADALPRAAGGASYRVECAPLQRPMLQPPRRCSIDLKPPSTRQTQSAIFGTNAVAATRCRALRPSHDRAPSNACTRCVSLQQCDWTQPAPVARTRYFSAWAGFSLPACPPLTPGYRGRAVSARE